MKLPDVHACVQTYTDLLAALIAFATHQLYSCIDVLLIQPLPYSVLVSLRLFSLLWLVIYLIF